ncbi:ABC transporter substrate-binding protein [Bradyrhizobium sp. DASA03007]|uniref:ABC transporter substrate-binding protein n=1 Tax=unclassified Bradyrhizobium TaxID=2631580 RepID=UPI003F725E93
MISSGTNARSWLFGPLVMVVGLLPLVSVRAAAAEPSKPAQIVINDSGGEMQANMRKIFYQEFEKRYGIRVLTTSPPDLGQLRAMVISGNVSWTITELTGQEAIDAEKAGLLESLDLSIIDLSAYPHHLRKRRDVFPKSVYSTVISYRTDKFRGENHPKSWADFFDVEKFPGMRSMQNTPVENLEFALRADGVAPDKLYPLDVDRAFKKLDSIKKHVAVWWTTGAQSGQALVDGEAVMGTAWNGRTWALMKQGAPLAIEWNQGAIKESAYGIPKGTPNAYWGQKFLALAAEPQPQGVYADVLGYPGLNPEAFKFVDPAVAPFMPTYPEHLSKQFWTNLAWWSENGNAVKERWSRWVLEN